MAPPQGTADAAAPVPPETSAPPGTGDTQGIDLERLAQEREAALAHRAAEDKRDPVESARTHEQLGDLTDRIVAELLDPESSIHDDIATAHDLLSRISTKAREEAERNRRLALLRREETHQDTANRYYQTQLRAEVHAVNLAARLAAEQRT